MKGLEGTYVNNRLDLAQDGGNGLADEGDDGEEARLADEDVKEDLVHTNELAESVKDGVRGGAGRDGRHALHLCDGRGRGGHNVGESGDEGLEDYALVIL